MREQKDGIVKILEAKTVATKMYGKHDMAYKIDKSSMYVTENDFIKHSKNIIDLIEVRRLCKWRICYTD